MTQRKITNERREFKGVFIPAEYWLNPNLSITKIVFMTEIDSLSSSENPCYASNKYFADFFGFSTVRVSQIISDLVEMGLLNRWYDKTETGQITKRYLTVNHDSRVLNFLSTPIKKTKGGIKFPLRGYKENFKENNTINNTRYINNNNDDSQKPQNPENQNQKPDQHQKQKYDDPITLYRENVVKFKPYEVETILDYLKAFTELSDNQNTANGIVSLALKQALDNDSLKMSYVGAILRSWLKDKVNSVEMAQMKTDEHKQQYNQPRNSSNAPHKKTWLDEHSSMETFDFDFGEANQ